MIQRALHGDEKPNDKIKVWDEDLAKAVVVWYVGTKPSRVRFSRTAGTKKTHLEGKKKKVRLEWEEIEDIDPALAFPESKNSIDIANEVAQINDVNESDFKADPRVIKLVLDRLAEHSDALNVEPAPHRVVMALSADETLKACLQDPDGLAELLDDDDYWLETIIDGINDAGVYRDMPSASGGSGSGGGSEEWKSEKLKKDKADLIAELRDALAEGFAIIDADSTLHHKISRSKFKQMLKLLNAATPTAGVQEMRRFIKLAGELTGRTSHDDEALENWAANIELGVLVSNRAEGDDPGEGFDGTYESGIATPRTARLEQASLIIDGLLTNQVGATWSALATELFAAQAAHVDLLTKNPRREGKLGLGALSRPKLAQWRPSGEEKFVRDKKDAGLKV